MAARDSEPSAGRVIVPPRVIVATRVFFGVIALAAMVFGYIGLHSFVHDHTSDYGQPTTTNLLYYDIALFLLQSAPAQSQYPQPWQLEVARFAAASFIVYTVAELGVAISANRVRQTRLRRASDHAVVCGNTRAARFVAAELKRWGMKVVVIDDQAERSERSADPWVVNGDPSNPRTLLAAGVSRAAEMYVCLEESQRNAEIVSAAERIRAGRERPGKIYALIADPELCVMMKARRWSSADVDGAPLLHVDFFNPDELAAQSAVRGDQSALDGPVPEFAIVGSGAFGRAVLVELARQWLPRKATAPVGARMRITLVADDAPTAAMQIRQRFPFIDEACVLRGYDGSLPQLLADRQRLAASALRRLYLCQDVESEALKSALTAVAYLRSSVDSVVVRLDRLSGIAEAFEGGLNGRALLDAFGGRLRVVDVVREGCDPAIIGDDLVETLARASHDRYVALRLAEGISRDGVVAMATWDELSGELQTSNREQAMDIGRKLARIGCLIAPRSEATRDFRFHGDEVEMLAELEHERWVLERERGDWTFGDTRDNVAKRHPDLVPWEELTEGSRQKDRETVVAIPGLLADVGLGIVRVSPNPGPGSANAAAGIAGTTPAGSPSAR